MGDPVNFYGELMDVAVDMRELSENGVSFNKTSNSIVISAGDLSGLPTGNYPITITGSYPEIDGTITTFDKVIYIFVDQPSLINIEVPEDT